MSTCHQHKKLQAFHFLLFGMAASNAGCTLHLGDIWGHSATVWALVVSLKTPQTGAELPRWRNWALFLFRAHHQNSDENLITELTWVSKQRLKAPTPTLHPPGPGNSRAQWIHPFPSSDTHPSRCLKHRGSCLVIPRGGCPSFPLRDSGKPQCGPGRTSMDPWIPVSQDPQRHTAFCWPLCFVQSPERPEERGASRPQAESCPQVERTARLPPCVHEEFCKCAVLTTGSFHKKETVTLGSILLPNWGENLNSSPEVYPQWN